MRQRSGYVLFRAFIDDNKISWAQAGRDLHVSHVAVMQWATGKSVPRPEHQEAIATWTGGRVPVSSWPRAEQIDVKPFRPTGS